MEALADCGWALPGAAVDDVLAEIDRWDQALVLVRNGDAVAEVDVRGSGWYWTGDWLNWVADGYNLHIRARKTAQILALIRAGRKGPTYSFNFVNSAGSVFWRVYARSDTTRERFVAYCEAQAQQGQAQTIRERDG